MAELDMGGNRTKVLRGVAARKVYDKGGRSYLYTPRDSIDVTGIVWMLEGLSMVRLGSDFFYTLTEAGAKALAELDTKEADHG
jgi:hypothetical protein